MPSDALVALIRCAPATVLADFERLIKLARFQQQLDPHATLLLRPDARRHFPFPAANTTPWQLEGVIRALCAAGCRDLTWMSPCTCMVNSATGKDLNGYEPILREYRILPHQTSDIPEPTTNVVLLPTLKTDAVTTIAGALRCLADQHAPSHAGWQRQAHEQLADALAAGKQHSQLFAVMDGTTVGIRSGGYASRPEVRNILLASTDPLALDAVAAQIMGLDPLRDVDYLRLGHERGLGVANPRAIELVGDADVARERWVFPRGTLHRRPTARRLIHLLRGDALERFRWSIAERSVFESWLRGTAWGRLFAHYQRRGYGRADDQALPLAESAPGDKTGM
ncbi:MAG TPA: DUF362 domain-containing protein [Roseiflexaceae bacterium]|nr:DUF362 domain-containing protein [Roseiflexaceae bacterium]